MPHVRLTDGMKRCMDSPTPSSTPPTPVLFCFVSHPAARWMATIATAQAGATSNLPRKPVPGLFSSLPTTIRKALRIPTPSQNPSNAGNGRYSAMTNTLAVGTGLQNSTTNMINGNQNNVCQVWKWTVRLIVFLTYYPQNCHVYPRRLDPTSGVIHDFCSRSCAKANSAIKCEVMFSAATSSQTVFVDVQFPILLP